MAECGICGQDKPQKKKYSVFTAIKRQSTIKTGFKEYETRTQSPIHFVEHQYSTCADCERKRRQIYPWILWVPLALIALFALGGIGQAEDQGVMEYAAFCLLPLAGLGYWITRSYIDIEQHLVKRAVEERKSGHWQAEVDHLPSLHRQQHGDPLAQKEDHVVGFKEAKAREVMKGS